MHIRPDGCRASSRPHRCNPPDRPRTQALSFTLMHGSAMMYGIRSSRYRALIAYVHIPSKPSAFVPESSQCGKLSAKLGPFRRARRSVSLGAGDEDPARRVTKSPNRLKAKTARLIASPGRSLIHGAVSANSTRRAASIRPHAARRLRARRVRESVSDASSRIAWPEIGREHDQVRRHHVRAACGAR